MNFTATDLDFELEHLRIDVANVDVLRKMTRAQERRVMGEVFVWWQKAKQKTAILRIATRQTTSPSTKQSMMLISAPC
jgi:hypothetical protein